MKFKCILSGCVYSFTSELDIKSMQNSKDYIQVPDEPLPKIPTVPTTIVQASPKPVAPSKPTPVAPAAPKAI